MNHIYLIGFMGSGKTTVAKILGKKMNRPVVELDDVIEEKIGITISEMFANHGEKAFRDVEQEVLKEISDKESLIVSCGGGVVLRQENCQVMKGTGKAVLLYAEPSVLVERLKNDTKRPLLANDASLERITNLLMRRILMYEEAADIFVDTTNKTPEEVADEIMTKL